MPNYPQTSNVSEFQNVDINENTEVNKTKAIVRKALKQLDPEEDQNHSVDSNDAIQKLIPSEIKDENHALDKNMLIFNHSSIESEDNIESEVLDNDYVLKEEADVLTYKLPAILDTKNRQESSKNITEVFLGTNTFQSNSASPPLETDDKSEGIIRSTVTVDDNLLHHVADIKESDPLMETTVQTMTVNMTSNTTHSDRENLTNITHTEDLEKEVILSTIKDFVEETTMYTLSDDQMPIKNHKIKKTNDIEVNILEDNVEEEITTVFPEVELTTTRRLPEKYMRTRARPPMTTQAPPTIINHNMNLQTALIINTLSKVIQMQQSPQFKTNQKNCPVLPNVPQSRLKNQPRLENIGSGVTFHQEEIFIFHTTLTELQVGEGGRGKWSNV